MKYTGVTYRPPFEAASLLLQVTRGCSYNKCTFCTMYRDEQFGTETLEQIESDLREASQYYPDTDRVFLENGDAFCLSAERLVSIAELVHKYLPKTETIAMYASINNIRGKSDEGLKELRRLGINDLNIGVESGLDSALQYMNKGYDAKEAEYQLLRLKDAGMDYGANIIFGCAGKEMSEEHARLTAELMNRTKPYIIFTGTIHAVPGCPLYDDLQSGAFKELTNGEYLDEMETFISALDIKDCFYFGVHPSNVIRLQGYLNEDKEKILAELKNRRERMKEKLDDVPVHHGAEGMILKL
ncbi:MAG: radical SAM protein [Lachnospiraceae bacterium]|nr:radical SAM protein [Lachnospiraceae bacterium]